MHLSGYFSRRLQYSIYERFSIHPAIGGGLSHIALPLMTSLKPPPYYHNDGGGVNYISWMGPPPLRMHLSIHLDKMEFESSNGENLGAIMRAFINLHIIHAYMETDNHFKG